MSSVRSHESTRMRIAPPDIVLSNWPLRDRKLVAWPLAVGLLVLSVAAGMVAQHWWVGLVSALVLAAAAWRWWFPVTFSFTPAGVTTTLLGRSHSRAWPTFARYEILDQGVMLTADDEDSPAATLRGLYVAWNDRRDELVTLLEFYLGSHSNDSRWNRSTVDGV